MHQLLLGCFRDLRHDGVPFPVFVVDELRVFQLAVREAQGPLAEVLRDHDGSIIITGPDAVDSIFLCVHNGPSEQIIALQRSDDLFAYVDIHVQHFGALVLVGDGEGDPAGLFRLIGVPVGQDVEPGVQAGEQDQADQDHDGDHVRSQRAEVAFDDAKNITLLHPAPPFRGGTEGSVRQSLRPCQSLPQVSSVSDRRNRRCRSYRWRCRRCRRARAA